MNDPKIIPLQQLYLSVLVGLINASKLDAVQQDMGPDTGRLWLVRAGTTVPQAWIGYRFGIDTVTFGVATRNDRKLEREVKYAEGIDGFIEDLQRFFDAGLIAGPKGVKRAA